MKLEAAGRPTETPRKDRLNLKGEAGRFEKRHGRKTQPLRRQRGSSPTSPTTKPLDYLLVLDPVSSKKASSLPVAALKPAPTMKRPSGEMAFATLKIEPLRSSLA